MLLCADDPAQSQGLHDPTLGGATPRSEMVYASVNTSQFLLQQTQGHCETGTEPCSVSLPLGCAGLRPPAARAESATPARASPGRRQVPAVTSPALSSCKTWPRFPHLDRHYDREQLSPARSPPLGTVHWPFRALAIPCTGQSEPSATLGLSLPREKTQLCSPESTLLPLLYAPTSRWLHRHAGMCPRGKVTSTPAPPPCILPHPPWKEGNRPEAAS